MPTVVSVQDRTCVGQKRQAARGGRFHLDPETEGVGVNVLGAFAEYLRLPTFDVVPLPDTIDDDLGEILDPLGNAVYAALSFDLVGEDILVTGVVPIGILAAAVARHVVVTDINPQRVAPAAGDIVPVDVSREGLKLVKARLGTKRGFDVGRTQPDAHLRRELAVRHEERAKGDGRSKAWWVEVDEQLHGKNCAICELRASAGKRGSINDSAVRARPLPSRMIRGRSIASDPTTQCYS